MKKTLVSSVLLLLQLAQLDDLKARGRITEDEHATMRKRLVEGVTPGALIPGPSVSPAPGPPTTPDPSLAGRWYGRDRSVLDIRMMDGRGAGRQLEWNWELVTGRVTMRATCPVAWSSGGTAPEPIDLLE
jgi:hypothetical protein